MLQDDAGDLVVRAGDEPAADRLDGDRRRAFRRKLPFGRGAVLSVRDRAHIVGLADVSVTGAYLTARAAVEAGEVHVLKVLLLPSRIEIALKAEVVRVSLADPESPNHPRGVAVRFLDVDETQLTALEAFVAAETARRLA
jgi:hypothetical protein